MPTISQFYGIKITMNYNDHSPPHFHAEYQDYEVLVDIPQDPLLARCLGARSISSGLGSTLIRMSCWRIGNAPEIVRR